MITEMLDRGKWERRGIDATLRLLKGVDSLLVRIRDGAGRRLDGVERAKTRLDERRKKIEAEETPAGAAPESVEKAA